MGRDERRQEWQEAIAAHRRALDSFVAAAERLSPADWGSPYAEGKWTRAEVAEHVRLTYVQAQAELTGKGGMKLRGSAAKRALLRLLFVPWILRRRRMPPRAPAVREIRPQGGPYEKASVLAALRADGERFMARLEELDPERAEGISHPFFGKLAPLTGLRFLTVHTEHHERQLAPPGAA